jgi:formylmethanofuran dehydrogenase subunit E
MNEAIWKKAVSFHGHECPGLAIGVRACDAAFEFLKIGASEDEQIVCVTENDACGVDAVQALLSCTIGRETSFTGDRQAGVFLFQPEDRGKDPGLLKARKEYRVGPQGMAGLSFVRAAFGNLFNRRALL